MRVFAVANQKGGVGKTTTAINLAACLAEMGHATLLVDLDPQANATSGLGFIPNAGESVYSVLLGRKTVEQQVRPTAYARLALLPSELNVAGCEIEMAQNDEFRGRLYQLLRSLPVVFPHEFIFLDCPPSLGIVMTTAIASADAVLVPLQCEYFALEGLTRVFQILQELGNPRENPPSRLFGVIMTMFDVRTNLSQQVVEDVRRHLGPLVFDTVIPRSVRLAEAPSYGKPIIAYDTAGTAAQAYRKLAREFLVRVQKKTITTPPSGYSKGVSQPTYG
ncbi:ParA family protein [Candidatus Methylacidithermus pantelleriae]|uniref:Chromosome partitioning protein ParA n=1 Tax=Candidatus Methylacidithermus pantelleriae TaxID=2744239 RepID=A0A8J2BR95_9BACT|nr:ParA family protein [Candidatus Methylacidithermus pantelleriae]CAF0705342.1 Chromosome partitioning protein ParA [Candidatus Methylacidithermus pantelleriae]